MTTQTQASSAFKRITLTGAKRYNLDGKLFVDLENDGKTPLVYRLDTETADYLLGQFDPVTGYDFFSEYTGPSNGRAPGAPEEDKDRVRSKGAAPKKNDRHSARERRGRVPREVSAEHARPGHESAPIDEDGVVV